MDKKKQRRLIISIICFVISFTCCYILLNFGNEHQEAKQTPDLPDVSVSGDLGYEPATADEVTIQATTGFVFQSHSLNQDVDIPNPKKNKYGFVISLYLGDGTLLYKSTIVNPGERISHIELSKSLDNGIYRNSIMVYRFYSTDDLRPVSQCEFPVEIKSVN